MRTTLFGDYHLKPLGEGEVSQKRAGRVKVGAIGAAGVSPDPGEAV